MYIHICASSIKHHITATSVSVWFSFGTHPAINTPTYSEDERARKYDIASTARWVRTFCSSSITTVPATNTCVVQLPRSPGINTPTYSLKESYQHILPLGGCVHIFLFQLGKSPQRRHTHTFRGSAIAPIPLQKHPLFFQENHQGYDRGNTFLLKCFLNDGFPHNPKIVRKFTILLFA